MTETREPWQTFEVTGLDDPIVMVRYLIATSIPFKMTPMGHDRWYVGAEISDVFLAIMLDRLTPGSWRRHETT